MLYAIGWYALSSKLTYALSIVELYTMLKGRGEGGSRIWKFEKMSNFNYEIPFISFDYFPIEMDELNTNPWDGKYASRYSY